MCRHHFRGDDLHIISPDPVSAQVQPVADADQRRTPQRVCAENKQGEGGRTDQAEDQDRLFPADAVCEEAGDDHRAAVKEGIIELRRGNGLRAHVGTVHDGLVVRHGDDGRVEEHLDQDQRAQIPVPENVFDGGNDPRLPGGRRLLLSRCVLTIRAFLSALCQPVFLIDPRLLCQQHDQHRDRHAVQARQQIDAAPARGIVVHQRGTHGGNGHRREPADALEQTVNRGALVLRRLLQDIEDLNVAADKEGEHKAADQKAQVAPAGENDQKAGRHAQRREYKERLAPDLIRQGLVKRGQKRDHIADQADRVVQRQAFLVGIALAEYLSVYEKLGDEAGGDVGADIRGQVVQNIHQHDHEQQHGKIQRVSFRRALPADVLRFCCAILVIHCAFPSPFPVRSSFAVRFPSAFMVR